MKPTINEVADYCRENGYKIDPIQFVNYYETRDWIVGRTRMKNWHSAIEIKRGHTPQKVLFHWRTR